MTQTSTPQRSNLKAVAGFVRRDLLRIVIASVLLAVPCFWQRYVGFGDFPSHVYNAWLYPKVARGELQGLAVSGQHTNILADMALTFLMRLVGVDLAQRLVLAGAALLMFWGVFALIASLRNEITWSLSPMIAMLSYGWAFQLGFLNSFIAAALALWLLA